MLSQNATGEVVVAPDRVAAVVGIDHYSSFPALRAGESDATAMHHALNYDGKGRRNCDMLTALKGIKPDRGSGPVTKVELMKKLNELFAKGHPHTHLIFYFAGHCHQNNWGVWLVTQDGSPDDPGVSLNELVRRSNDCAAAAVTIILDCCGSGIAGDDRERVQLRKNVTILASSAPDQAAREVCETINGEEVWHGEFTRLLLDGLAGAAADIFGEVTAPSLYEFCCRVRPDLKPVLKTYLPEPLPLRTVAGRLDSDDLRKLTRYFHGEHSEHPLDGDYEVEGGAARAAAGEEGISRGDKKATTAKEHAFDYLNKLHKGGHLLDFSVDDATTGKPFDALYWACVRGGSVWLNTLGRYYWRLAKAGRFNKPEDFWAEGSPQPTHGQAGGHDDTGKPIAAPSIAGGDGRR
jgi:hypothetical protein